MKLIKVYGNLKKLNRAINTAGTHNKAKVG